MSSSDQASSGRASSDQVSVERTIAAPPEAIFDLLADPRRHPEIDGSGTLRSAIEGPERLERGSVFGMHMQMGFRYRMVNEVIEHEEGRRLAWQTRPANPLMARLVGGRIWRYELEPVEGGTLVRETWDISQERLKLLVAGLRTTTGKNMAASLERLDHLATP